MKQTSSNLATIRAVVFSPMIRALDEKGRMADVLLARHGLSRARIHDPYAIISLIRYVEIFEAVARQLKEPALGLRIGGNSRPTDLGPLGLLISAAPTLRSAFTRLSEFISALQGATRVGLQHHKTMTAWTYQVEDSSIWPRVQDTEFSLAAACQLARSLAGSSWSPLEVHFEHDEPEDCSAHHRFFRAPLLFRQPANRLLLLNADIDRVIQTEDCDLTQILEHHVRDLLAERMGETDLARRVERIIALYLGHEKISVERLAADLGLAPRTLQRNLGREGTSVRQLLREHRQKIAKLQMQSNKISQAEIAHALGYSDGTVFWRAFKDWTGTAPTKFRKRNGKR